MQTRYGDTPGSAAAPTSETAREQAGRIEGQARADDGDSRSTAHVEQALRVIEGEEYARAYLDRLQAGSATPGELAVVLAFLDGEMLNGACRVIEKALGVRHA